MAIDTATRTRILAGEAAGLRLVARFKKQDYACVVSNNPEDSAKKVFVLEHDGTEHSSLSAAGSAIMGGVSCNGWRFWSVSGTEPAPNEQPEPGPRSAKRKPGGAKLIKRVANQQGIAEGSVRYFCSSCMAGFIVDDGSEPMTCPQGHPATAEPATA